ncbi:hypothetical protein KVR01_011919 [Diaporthe batatas]|uniref:uncharacterized protein n=1 Tax=Diaporthe batatas TaxID=748121 RepID=UPI001D04A826|nr:uncharacterized protein KVR01_011919 [Diaporthe batatas]KAG8158158.1 hypothetical protein KVR01_011919 [Diaporthe batatas]
MLCYAIVLAFIGLDMSIVSTAIPSITDEFHTVTDVGYFAVMFGNIHTLFPVRPVLMGCIVLFMLGSLMGATAPSSMVYVVSRAVCGMATAGIAQGCFYMLVHIVPLRKRPVIVGNLNGVEALANISSPSVWCFAFCRWAHCRQRVMAMAVVVFALKIDLKNRSALLLRQELVELDLVGNLLFIPSLICLFLALSWAGTKYPWDSGTKRRGDEATLPPRILANRSVLAGFIFAVCTNAAINVFKWFCF